MFKLWSVKLNLFPRIYFSEQKHVEWVDYELDPRLNLCLMWRVIVNAQAWSCIIKKHLDKKLMRTETQLSIKRISVLEQHHIHRRWTEMIASIYHETAIQLLLKDQIDILIQFILSFHEVFESFRRCFQLRMTQSVFWLNSNLEKNEEIKALAVQHAATNLVSSPLTHV